MGDTKAVEAVLRRHCSGVFSERRSCPVARAEYFVALLAARPSAAPGPDGLPHTAWQAGGELAVGVLQAA